MKKTLLIALTIFLLVFIAVSFYESKQSSDISITEDQTLESEIVLLSGEVEEIVTGCVLEALNTELEQVNVSACTEDAVLRSMKIINADEPGARAHKESLYGILYFTEGKSNLINAYIVTSSGNQLVFLISKAGFDRLIDLNQPEHYGENLIMSSQQTQDGDIVFFADLKKQQFVLIDNRGGGSGAPGHTETLFIESSFTRSPISIHHETFGGEQIDFVKNPELAILGCDYLLFDGGELSKSKIRERIRITFDRKQLSCIEHRAYWQPIDVMDIIDMNILSYIDLTNNSYVEVVKKHSGIITSISKSGDNYTMSIDYIDLFPCEGGGGYMCIKNMNKKIRTFAIADDVLVSTNHTKSCEHESDQDQEKPIGSFQYSNLNNFPDFLATRESCKNSSTMKRMPYEIWLDKNNVIRMMQEDPLFP